MKTIGINLIALPLLGIISTTGIIAAETDKQAPSPETRIEESPSPAELTATRCLICHGNNQTGTQRLAPPFAMVKMHYQSLDEKAFIKTVSAWIKAPDKQKSRMPGAINRFGLMPAFPYPDAEIAAIAKYVYATNFPMPGGGGQGMGGMDCAPETSTAPDAKPGCVPGKCAAPKAAGSGCDACEPAKSGTSASVTGATDKSE